MEFDKSRVYTTLNTDEVKVGSTIIPADNLMELKCRVKKESMLFTLAGIREESNECRFITENGSSWALAYLVSEPEEKKLKWTDLKIGDVIKKKHEDGYRMAMVLRIDTYSTDKHISTYGEWLSEEDLEDWEKVEDDND